MLAYFPKFFSGINSGYFILKSAFECRNKFHEIYEKHSPSFQVVLADTGLCIGIDFGEVCIINFNNYYTPVGAPVVYACRLSTEVNIVALNQKAYNELHSQFSESLSIEKTKIEIKNEGLVKVYFVEPESGFDLLIIPDPFGDLEKNSL